MTEFLKYADGIFKKIRYSMTIKITFFACLNSSSIKLSLNPINGWKFLEKTEQIYQILLSH